jgi:hypothetical protein
VVAFIIVIIHSDDLAWGYSCAKDFEELLECIKTKYTFTRRKNPKNFRGIEIAYNTDGSITTHMVGFLNDLEVNHNLQNCKNFRQPGRTNCVKIEESMAGCDIVCTDGIKHTYMVVQGELLWQLYVILRALLWCHIAQGLCKILKKDILLCKSKRCVT